MPHSDEVWRWVAKGVGGIVNMVATHHEDVASEPCPKQWLDEIEKHAERLLAVVREQRAE